MIKPQRFKQGDVIQYTGKLSMIYRKIILLNLDGTYIYSHIYPFEQDVPKFNSVNEQDPYLENWKTA